MRYEKTINFSGYKAAIIKEGSAKPRVQIDMALNPFEFLQESLELEHWEMDLAAASMGVFHWTKELTTVTSSQQTQEAQIFIGNLYGVQRKFEMDELYRMSQVNASLRGNSL